MSKIIQTCPKCGKVATHNGFLRGVEDSEVDLRDPLALANRKSITELIALHDALVDSGPYFCCDDRSGCGEWFSYLDSYPDARRLAVAQFLFGQKV